VKERQNGRKREGEKRGEMGMWEPTKFGITNYTACTLLGLILSAISWEDISVV